jgi:ectoine hydroxylase-related dioxygenase (phytanoyl-CoA dioxygenase family)
MEHDKPFRNAFEKDGRFWLRNAISNEDLLRFDEAAKVEAKAGQRVNASPALEKALAENGSLLSAIRRLDPNAKPVKIVAFNKSRDTNWGVPWHQDRVIAVAEKQDVLGFENWTKKSEVWHCEPPQDLLDQMLFVRVHLDDTDQSNGAMTIAVGSHVNGVVPSKMAEATAHRYPIEDCEAKRGDVLVLKMLTLHSSKPSEVKSDRRVFRIDFSSFDLPAPLRWIKRASGN